MTNEVTVFLHDGVVEGVFASSTDTNVCIVEFDPITGKRAYENMRWEACRAAGMHLIIPEHDYCEE